MSRKQENIGIEVNELTGRKVPTWEVVVPKKFQIGLIELVDGKYRVTSIKSNSVMYAKTLDAGISDLLAYFTLHEK